MADLTRDELEALAAAEAKATAAPWEARNDQTHLGAENADRAEHSVRSGDDRLWRGNGHVRHDMSLAALARNALPELIAMARRTLEAEAAAARRLEVLKRMEWGARPEANGGVAMCPACGAFSDLENGEWQGKHHGDCAIARELEGT